MTNYPRVILKPGKEEPVRRFHPWVFSGALGRTEGKIEEGEIVEVFSSSGEYLATGHAQRSSIAVKIFSFDRQEIGKEFWEKKLTSAYKYRQSIGLAEVAGNEAFRLVNGEGDGLPGLIIDYFSGLAVIQCHSVGMHLCAEEIALALKQVFGEKLQGIYEKSAELLSESSEYEMVDGFLLGEGQVVELMEDGLRYLFDLKGQKTGFFLDQRENRKIAERFSRDRKVLDVFCYSGGFSLHALRGGAALVHAVDSSRKATDLVNSNVELNGYKEKAFSSFTVDAKQYLEGMETRYDMIILDPPAFAKHHDMRSKAIRGYRSLNYQAIKKILPGGILITFSCSQAIDRETFLSTVMSAAIDAGRNARIIQHMSQSPDHPVSLFHPEGSYLKGLVVYIE